MINKSYLERSKSIQNPTAKKLLELMELKKTNLSVAADVTTKKELLELADTLGPYICVLKTHIDIIVDFDMDLVEKLGSLAVKHNFLIFEDRKFADIGNTVKNQYGSGIYKIASWSHFTNAHSIPGDSIVQGLKEVGLPLSRGLLLLAEMSSKGCLATNEYANETLKMALRHSDFVFGFIGQRRLELPSEETTDFLYLTPGVQLTAKGDQLGQQYRTPEQVILESGCDIIIVGRGIYGTGDIIENAKTYQKAGWDAYLKRLSI